MAVRVFAFAMVLAFEEVSPRVYTIPRVITYRLNSKTQRQLFLLLYGRHVGVPPSRGHQHGFSIQSSINLVENLHFIHKISIYYTSYLNANQNAFLRQSEASWHQSLEKGRVGIGSKTSDLHSVRKVKMLQWKQYMYCDSLLKKMSQNRLSSFYLTSPVEAISHLNNGSASRSLGHENIGAWRKKIITYRLIYRFRQPNFTTYYVRRPSLTLDLTSFFHFRTEDAFDVVDAGSMQDTSHIWT